MQSALALQDNARACTQYKPWSTSSVKNMEVRCLWLCRAVFDEADFSNPENLDSAHFKVF